MKLLVTGGAGYIGSVTAAVLLDAGHEVTVLDDLSTGHRSAVPAKAQLVVDNVRNAHEVLHRDLFDGVLHFAARSVVADSVTDPQDFWHNNVGGTMALLDAVRAAGVPRFVFSSTAATYGEPERTPILETDPARPEHAYGASKLAVDHMLAAYAPAYGLAATSLRYFNVAGAYEGPQGRVGELHDPETHLIPLVLEVAAGRRPHIDVCGADWPTPDGTCVRDYIHVVDLARAHVLALEKAVPGEHHIYNLGSGTGFSVREVIDACRRVTGREIPERQAPRRPGDPAVLVASSEKTRRELGWEPEKADLDTIIQDAWSFMSWSNR